MRGLGTQRIVKLTAFLAVGAAALGIVGCGSSSPSDQDLLGGLVVSQADVPAGNTVRLFMGGDQVVGQVTLDLCSASFPSEGLRTARRQVGVLDSQGGSAFSTEAVTYANPGATTEAFDELRSAQANCPHTFLPSSVAGEPPLETVFNPPPDTSWPPTTGVERLAFNATISDSQGQSADQVAVYLRRGRVLLALYFHQPESPQVAIDGQTTIPGIVAIFASRLANLPASAVGE